MIREGKEHISLRPIHDDCFSLPLLLLRCTFSKMTRSVFHTGCHKMRESVLCNKCHATYSQSLHCRATVSSRTFHRKIQSEAVAQNKCFETGVGGAFKAALSPDRCFQGCFASCTVDNNRCASKVFSVCSSPLLLRHHFHSSRVWLFPHSKVINQMVLGELRVDYCNLLSCPNLEKFTGVVSGTSLNAQPVLPIVNLDINIIHQ